VPRQCCQHSLLVAPCLLLDFGVLELVDVHLELFEVNYLEMAAQFKYTTRNPGAADSRSLIMAVAMKYGRVSARISGLAVVRREGIYCGSWRVDSGTRASSWLHTRVSQLEGGRDFVEEPPIHFALQAFFYTHRTCGRASTPYRINLPARDIYLCTRTGWMTR
jgi:hypothetical protein